MTKTLIVDPRTLGNCVLLFAAKNFPGMIENQFAVSAGWNQTGWIEVAPDDLKYDGIINAIRVAGFSVTTHADSVEPGYEWKPWNSADDLSRPVYANLLQMSVVAATGS
jgi:hypothetical protein